MNYRELTNAVLQMLATATGKLVGDAGVPEEILGSVATDADFPYLVVEQAPGSYIDGGLLVRRDSNVGISLRVTAVGRTREQTQWMQDAAREAILGRTSPPAFDNPLPGCYGRDIETVGGISTDGDGPTRVYNLPCDYTFWTDATVT